MIADRIAIVGLGRMGRWLAEELSKDHRVATVESVAERRLGGEHFVELPELAALRRFDPTLVINCVSLAATRPVQLEILEHTATQCVVADIASVKSDLHDLILGQAHRTVSLHPMFGPKFANLASLTGERALILEESCDAGKLFFHRFFAARGVAVEEIPLREHDTVMANALALPYLTSLGFAAAATSLGPTGTSFRRHSELAAAILSESDEFLLPILSGVGGEPLRQLIAELLSFQATLAGSPSEPMEYLKCLRLRMEALKGGNGDNNGSG